MGRIILTVLLMALPVTARAAWTEPMPGPNLSPTQGQFTHHEVNVNVAPTIHVHNVQQPRPIVHNAAPVIDHSQTNGRHDAPVREDRHLPGYQFHRDLYNYVRQENVIVNNIPVADIAAADNINVPDGFESIVVDGQTYFYAQGVFYQQENGQLTAIDPVLGAVVDSIPEGYTVITADGVNYLFINGIYFERVAQGFEVVVPSFLEQS